MDRNISRGRLATLAAILVLLLAIYIVALYKLQIVEGAAYYERSQNSIVTTQTIKAARGNILDRYGRVLVSNRTCNNIVLDTNELFGADKVDDPNAVLLELAEIVKSCGDEYTNTLPITKSAPFEYEYSADIQSLQKNLLEGYISHNNEVNDAGLGDEPTAVELMAYFRSRYDIDGAYDSEQMRIIAGLRYDINVRHIVNTSDYIFVEDASIELITKLMESNLPGFDVEVSYIREYNTSYAAHVLGYTTLMSPEDYEGVDGKPGYKDKGYRMDAYVGKDGAEWAFEEYLHGSDGEAAVTRTSTGVVTSTVYTKEPEPGNHLYLSIDIGLQEAAENSLASNIARINETRKAEYEEELLYGETEEPVYAPAGAVVAIDVKSGEALCLASYPTFDLETFLENFEEISEDPDRPLWNRALMGAYAPGSTFKPVTAMAGLDTGVITTNTTIYCSGIYEKFAEEGYTPKCWIYGAGSHGDLAVAGAVEHSCNIFFYTVGNMIYHIDTLAEYAAAYGLGEYTGIELPETKGHMASKEYKASLYPEDPFEAQWFDGDTIQAAIGQSISQFTPVQLANYAAGLANRGLRYRVSILKSVRSFNYSETVYENEHEILGNADYDSSYYDEILYGMRQVVASGTSTTVYNVFKDVGYTVAAKTGTAQTGVEDANDGLFICYAPYEDPEIAIAVVVEKGGSGSAVATIAKDVLDYYFNFAASTTEQETELELLR